MLIPREIYETLSDDSSARQDAFRVVQRANANEALVEISPLEQNIC